MLSTLGGHNVGETIHRIMAKLGTNKLWSQYSLKGRKGKFAFKGVTLCNVVKSRYFC